MFFYKKDQALERKNFINKVWNLHALLCKKLIKHEHQGKI